MSKPAPVNVTDVPPAIGPEAGSIDDTDTKGRYEKGTLAEAESAEAVVVVARERVVATDPEVDAGATQMALVEVIFTASTEKPPKWQKSVAEELVGKLDPLTVTWVPPLSWVKLGTAAVTTGDGRKVKVAARLLNSAPPFVEAEM